MAAVDPGYADWLRAEALYTSATDTAFAAIWGDRAIETTIVSTIALKVDAIAEALRQYNFLKGPLVIDVHDVVGLHHALLGQVVTLTIDRLGYAAGAKCFVIAVAERETIEVTALTVVRRLLPGEEDGIPLSGLTLDGEALTLGGEYLTVGDA